ncbi:hypothetical protein [Streptomyces sp. C11-1]
MPLGGVRADSRAGGELLVAETPGGLRGDPTVAAGEGLQAGGGGAVRA